MANESCAISLTTRTSATCTAGSYSETPLPVIDSQRPCIPRLYPVPAGNPFEADAEDKYAKYESSVRASVSHPTNALRTRERFSAFIKTLCDKHPNSSVFEFQWKHRTTSAIRQSLEPLVVHYKIQIFLLDEVRERRVITNEEFTGRHMMQVKYRYGRPLKEKLLGWYKQHVLDVEMFELRRTSSRMSSMILPSRPSTPFHTPFSAPHSSPVTSNFTPLGAATLRPDELTNTRTLASFEATLCNILRENEATICGSSKGTRSPNWSEYSGGGSIPTVSRRLSASRETARNGSHEITTPLKKIQCESLSDEDSLARSVLGSERYEEEHDSLAQSLFGPDETPEDEPEV